MQKDEARTNPAPRNGEDASRLPHGKLINWIRSCILSGNLSPQDRREVLNQLFFERHERVPYLYRFATLVGLSTAIATFGLMADSGTVVIGAMLVAPLLTPILAVAAAVVMGWHKRQFRSLSLILIAAVGAISLAWVIAYFSPDKPALPDEVLLRTSPGLFDLGIALAAGAAGAYTLVKREPTAIPGVAIAVALVPPLASVGITLEAGRRDLALEALLLFSTNLLAIILAASVILLITGFTPRPLAMQAGMRIRRGLATAFLGVLMVSVPLGIHSKHNNQKTVDQHRTNSEVEDWLADLPLDVTDVEISSKNVIIDVAGPSPPPPAKPLVESLQDEFGSNFKLTVRWTQRTEEVVEP